MATRVFISYAREDVAFARQLHRDLRLAGVAPWLDQVDLVPGQPWEATIRSVIAESSYFIALMSSRSVAKRGYVQKETRIALDIAKEYPENQVFVIPVRIDECQSSFDDLRRLHRADLFPSYADGLNDLLRVFRYVSDEEPALTRSSIQLPGTISDLRIRGFGFIAVDAFKADLFFHASELCGVMFDELREGDAITFSLAHGPTGFVATEIARV